MTEENQIKKALIEAGEDARIVGVSHTTMEMHSGLGPFINCECCGDNNVPVEETEDDNGVFGHTVEFCEVHLEFDDGEDDALLFDEPVALCEYCERDAFELVDE